MGVFNRNKGRPTPAEIGREHAKQRVHSREELLESLKQSRVDAMTAQEGAAYDARVCIARAKQAIARGNSADKAIAFNELRMHLVLYYYARAVVTNLRIMESNAKIQGITENFSNLVDRMNSLKLSSGSADIQRVVARAMKGMRPVDLVGVEDMMRKLLESAVDASSIAQVDDEVLEDLVNGKIELGDNLFARNARDAERPAARPKEEQSLEELLKLLE